MNRRYSGSELALSRPSQLNILPRTGFTSTLSRVSLEATSIQYSRFTVDMYTTLNMTNTPTTSIA